MGNTGTNQKLKTRYVRHKVSGKGTKEMDWYMQRVNDEGCENIN